MLLLINSTLKPDVLKLFSRNKKFYIIKFVSDVDSTLFRINVNTSVNFIIVYRNIDTCYTRIEFSDKYEESLTKEDRLFALSVFWSEVKYNFAQIDKISFNIDSLYRSYIPKVIAAKNDFEFYDLLEVFAAAFQDLHTSVYYRLKSNYTNFIGLGCNYFGNDLKITSVREDLLREIPLGSLIFAVNNIEINEYVKKYIRPYINSDLESTIKYLSASRLFSDIPYNSKFLLTIKKPNGNLRSFFVPVDGKEKQNLNIVGAKRNSWIKPIELSWQKNNIALLKINSFDDRRYGIIKSFESLKDSLHLAKALIIDLRQNLGGSTDVAWHILKYLINDPYFLNFGWRARVNNSVKKANGNYVKQNVEYYLNREFQTYLPDTIFIQDSIKRIDIPTAVLISETTASAAEDFLIILSERKTRPIFIGRPTLGSTGSPLVVRDFPQNGFARISARKVLFPYSMKNFDYIKPDILVQYSPQEMMESKLDKDIEAAIAELGKNDIIGQ